MKIIILGAGITGLAAAAHLCGRGHRVIILEKTGRAGGLAATLHRDNYTMDYGAFVCYPQLKALLPEPVRHAIQWQEVRHINAQLYRDDQYIDWPVTPSYIFKQLGFIQSGGAFLDFAVSRLKTHSPAKIKHAEDFIIKKIGKKLYRFSDLEGEILKLTGKPAWELSTRFVSDHLFRFEHMSLLRMIRNRLPNIFKRTGHTVQAPAYPEYPLGGIGRIPLEMEHMLAKNRVEFYKSVDVQRIHQDGNRVTGVTFTLDGQTRTEAADGIISTIPVDRAFALTNEPGAVQSPGHTLQYRHLLLLFLMVRTSSLTGHQLTYAFDGDVPFKRLVEFKHYENRNAPEGHTGIAVEICFTDGEEIKPLSRLYTLVKDSLVDMGLLEPGDITAHCFRTSCHAYPVEALGYEQIRDRLLESVTRDNMISCGRQGIYRYSQMSFGYKMGIAAADHFHRGILNKGRHLELCYDFAYNKSIGGD
jgi:protoporphyrinogen oxidase